MAKTLWQWTDGVGVHTGYTTKAKATQAMKDYYTSLGFEPHESWAFKVSSYHADHTVSGIRQRFSRPSRGADSLYRAESQMEFRRKLTGQDKPATRRLRSRHECTSCGEKFHTALRYAQAGVFDYYGCPDTTCCEELPAGVRYWMPR